MIQFAHVNAVGTGLPDEALGGWCRLLNEAANWTEVPAPLHNPILEEAMALLNDFPTNVQLNSPYRARLDFGREQFARAKQAEEAHAEAAAANAAKETALAEVAQERAAKEQALAGQEAAGGSPALARRRSGRGVGESDARRAEPRERGDRIRLPSRRGRHPRHAPEEPPAEARGRRQA